MNTIEFKKSTEKVRLLDDEQPFDRPRSVSSNCEELDDDNDNDETPLNPFKIPEKFYQKIFWLLLFPINLLFFLTIPDCRRQRFSKFPWYFFTFIISTIYIGAITYVEVWMVIIVGKNFKI